MKFSIKDSQNNQSFVLIYREEEYSFDVDPTPEGCGSSIMINDLQLEIDDTGAIIYVWGYCPLIKYKETEYFPKNYEIKSLIALLSKPPIPGISYRLNEDEDWQVFINKKKRWVCLGNPRAEENMIEFAPNCIASLKDQEIIAIWLQPQSLPTF